MKGNLLFLTGCYPREMGDFFDVNSKVMPQNAMNVLSWRIIEGLEENIPGRFKVVSCPFIGYYPNEFNKLIIDDFEWSHNGSDKNQLLGFINIKGFETWQKSKRIYRYVKKWYKQSENNRHILVYSHYAGFLKAMGKVKKTMPDMSITCLVTDMNELDERKDLMGIKGKIKGIPRSIMIHITYKNLKYISSFVLLAEPMRAPLKVGNRPFVVVEGISDGNLAHLLKSNKFKKNKDEFRVVYTGTLHKRYGAIMLAEAIKSLENSNISLYICGSGDSEKEVETIAKKCERIKYLGIIPHADAIELQSTADLLVNSMPNFGIHTELSFPSKTMEYMAMGKPVACFKVKGIPNDYDSHLMYFDEESVSGIARMIAEVSKMDKQNLEHIGKENKKFVMENKTPKIQVKHILDMLEQV